MGESGLDRASGGRDRQGGEGERADRGGGDPGEVFELEHGRSPEPCANMKLPIVKQGACQLAEMAENRQILSDLLK
jgi:hypothetical protein